MNKAEPGQLWVMRIHALIAGLVAVVAAIGGEIAIARETDLPTGLALVPVLILLIYPILLAPARHYHALGYALEGDELHVASGVWTRTETVVPLGRVQHIDVSQGPIERAFGVTRLVLHTAGTMNSLVVVPGLARPTAEAIRDEIRSRIRLDAS
jgi:membrane protein YdbS with pleckstrin-like domain